MTKAATATITTNFKLFKIKPFIFLMILCVFVLADLSLSEMTEEEALDKRLRDIRRGCIKFSNVTKIQARLIYKHKLFHKNATTKNTAKQLQCFCACYLKGFGIFVNDKPDEDFLRKNLPLLINDSKKANDVLDKCVVLEGSDMCEKAFNFELCVARETSLSMC